MKAGFTPQTGASNRPCTNIATTPPSAPAANVQSSALARCRSAFASMTLPPLDPGLRWNTNQFATDSTITVVAIAPRISASLSGTNLTLQFPTEIGVKYVLQSATNLTTPTIWTSQQTNAGNGTVQSLEIPINPAEPQKYFRLLAN